MIQISANITEENFKKIQTLKAELQQDSDATISFADALNILLRDYERRD